ncbi:MAG: hypothetical protein K0M49_07525 [Arenimonas sp.]|nr:hypothetical protein [Rhizobium sp.]MBW8445464.1 hypothetical protein [Arenimonas sp.]
MPNYIYSIPIATETVVKFLREEKDRYINDYKEIRQIVVDNLGKNSYYKVYGREDRQPGEYLKAARKIKLKFDKHHRDTNLMEGSIWTTPDVVGFTIVVLFPSDISEICAVIDRLIDSKKIKAAPLSRESTTIEFGSPISTIYGRRITKGGYFACHYNIVTGGIVDYRKPIIEIQIKTVLHDAWGLKTHDLTYKSTGRSNKDLVRNFNLLGDSLANMDMQTDILRKGITKNSSILIAKEDNISRNQLEHEIELLKIEDEPYKGIYDSVKAINNKSRREEIESIESKIWDCGTSRIRLVARLYFYLALKCSIEKTYSHALDVFSIWLEHEKSPLGRAVAHHIVALAALNRRQFGPAIESAESALELLDSLDTTDFSPSEHATYTDRLSRVLNLLAYCHASLIGSHEGDYRDSRTAAQIYIETLVAQQAKIGALSQGIFSPAEEIEAVLIADNGWDSYCHLDTEMYVRSQLADDEYQLQSIRNRVEKIYEEREGFPHLVLLHRDFIDYVIRSRLNEVEQI